MECMEPAGRSRGPRINPRPRSLRVMSADDGLTLIEVLIAMVILVAGMLGLAHVFYMGVTVTAGSSATVLAREKAREAIESVHAARDSGTVTWAQVRNANPPNDCPEGTTSAGGGIFFTGSRNLGAPGLDGLVNTGDDTAIERAPGKDNVFGTADDIEHSGFTRQISICEIPENADLRMIIVTIRYNTARPQTYTLRSYVSRFS
jgi:prepilin-type N-terminal cleavage/methylation domain-containing protein